MYNFELKVFAERLKELREEKNLTINGIAKEIGIPASSISRWENQKRMPTIDSLFMLAQYFNVTTDYLLGLEN